MSDQLDLFGEAAKAADKPAAKKPAKKRAAKKEEAPEVVASAPKKNSKSGWPIIWIDAVEGMPNYEVVGLNGDVFKIMRETEVPVPPAVMEILKHAEGIRLMDVPHPMGGITRKKQKYMTIPWRMVGIVP